MRISTSAPGIGIARIALLALTLLLVLSLYPEHAGARDSSGGLSSSVLGLYEIEPDAGHASVNWHVELVHRGTPPGHPGPYQPGAVALLVDSNHSKLSALTASGQPLATTITPLSSDLSEVTVHFGRVLSEGESFEFSYSYTLGQGDGGFNFIRSGYMHLLARPEILATGGFETVAILISAPASYRDRLAVAGGGCELVSVPGRVAFECVQDEAFDHFVQIEAVDPTRRIVTSEIVVIDGRQIELILRYLRGDEAWAALTRDIVIRGMPVIGDIMGLPYSGPPVVRITERGRQEIFGAAGVAACDQSMCAAAVAPSAGELVLLHELVHMWHEPYSNRWIVEGQAELVSRIAAARIGHHASHDHGPYSDRSFPLDSWGNFVDFLDSPEDLLQREYDGYHWSHIFFESFVEQFGLGPFQLANAYLDEATRRSIDSRFYMDALEDIGGAPADALFMDMIFPPDEHHTILARRQARDRFASLEMEAALAPELPPSALAALWEDITAWDFDSAIERLDTMEPGLQTYLGIRDQMLAIDQAAEEAGLAYPVPFKQRMETWDFAPLASEVPLGLPAVTAYLDARAIVEAPRGFWTNIGLFGKNPSERLQRAADAFAWASFAESIEHSTASVAMIDGAGKTAARNVAIGVVLLAIFVAVVAAILFWPSGSLKSGDEPAGSV